MDLAVIIFFTIAYFAPSLADGLMNNGPRAHVFLVNLLSGWTLIAWVYAFIWVFQERRRNRKYKVRLP